MSKHAKVLARAIKDHAASVQSRTPFSTLGEVVDASPLTIELAGSGVTVTDDELFVSDQIDPFDLMVGANVAMLAMVVGPQHVEWAVVATLTRP